MKTLKLLSALFLLSFMSVNAQDHVTLNVSQDAKLLFAGDSERNYGLGTADISIRSEWQGSQYKYGYIFAAPEFEYANLKSKYVRYSINTGFTLNRLYKDYDFTVSVGYGMIDRSGDGGYGSYGGNLQLSKPIFKGVKIFVDAEFLERGDIDTFRLSGKFGVKINLI